MGQEKMKILELLEKGQISAEEAIKLMQFIDSAEGSPEGQAPFEKAEKEETKKEEPDTEEVEDAEYREADGGKAEEEPKSHKESDFDFDFDWVRDIKDNIKETVENIAHYVESTDALNIFPFTGVTEHLHHTFTDIENIRSLQLMGKNSKVEVVGQFDNRIEVTVNYKAKRGFDPRIEFESVGGDYRVKYDYSAVTAIGYYVRVPNRMIEYLDVETTNNKLIIQGIQAGKATLATKNALVNINQYSGDDVAIETKNAPVCIENMRISRVSVKTGNASVTIKESSGDVAKIMTSNASVKIDEDNFRDISIKTTNAAINFSNFAINKGSAFYNITARTSNGSINLDLPVLDEIALRLSAITSLGHVNANMRRLDLFEQNKGYLKAESRDFESAESKLNVSLQTSNGNITIKD